MRELGGSAEAKSPVPTHGWFAACSDSEGNAFHLWQADPAPPEVRRLALTIGSALLVLGAAAPALAKPPPVAFSDCLGPSVKPEDVLLACGDGTESFHAARWTRWTRLGARAVGMAQINDCTPSCVDGHDHTYRAVLLLDRPRACGGRRLFTRVRLVLTGPPGGGQPVGSIVMCPVR